MSILSHTQSLCPACKRTVPADIVERDGRIWLSKRCETHGGQETLLSSDAAWYRDALSFPARLRAPAFANGRSGADCPRDCGLCAGHQQAVCLPVVPVTSACNLSCPVCYTLNKNRAPYHMTTEEFAAVLAQIRRMDPSLQLINFTGGEPLLHPAFVRLVEMCHDAGIHRITVSTNGLRFLDDETLLAALTRLDARIVLSWNSFESLPYVVTAGQDLLDAKLRILELLRRHKPTTTLLSVVAAGLNDGEIGAIVRAVMESDFIVSSEIHTITFTGQNEGRMDHALRITPPDIIRRIAEANPWLRPDDFIPSPCAHPLCYSVCYALKLGDGDLVPLTRLMPRARLHELLEGQLYLEPSAATEQLFREMIDDLWARADDGAEDGRLLRRLRAMMDDIYPPQPLTYLERQRRSERYVKAVYLHSHMDADNFDLARIRQCCVAVPSADGAAVPTCSYNNFHRARDARFHTHPGDPACATL